MKTTKVPEVREPTAAQVTARTDQKVARHKEQELEELRRQKEAESRAELHLELNQDYYLALAEQDARSRGWTFLRDVWPDHPAAGHRIGVAVNGVGTSRPCGVRPPFGLSKDGPTFELPEDGGVYRISSPVFLVRRPGGKGRTFEVGVLVDGGWRTVGIASTLPEAVEHLSRYGLVFNPKACVYRSDAGGARRVLSAPQLLGQMFEATMNEVPWSG